jgi:hypothetical protein
MPVKEAPGRPPVQGDERDERVSLEEIQNVVHDGLFYCCIPAPLPLAGGDNIPERDPPGHEEAGPLLVRCICRNAEECLHEGPEPVPGVREVLALLEGEAGREGAEDKGPGLCTDNRREAGDAGGGRHLTSGRRGKHKAASLIPSGTGSPSTGKVYLWRWREHPTVKPMKVSPGIAKLTNSQIKKVQKLEEELGVIMVAHERLPMLSELSQAELKALKETEKKLGVTLVAYRKE